ncbi:transposase [Amycolatopsis thermophila]|uniref:transposase n=1 Tax=Amycolatopsis thermophila TaxID=206084 RepID=UPI003F9A842A
MPASRRRISTPRTSPATQGAGPNYTKPGIEPPDHAIGRSRGGWTTKIHRVVDGNGRGLVTLLTPGQAGDSPMFEPLMAHLRVPRLGGGRARTRPDRVRGDKAYSSRAIRTHLRSRGIRAVIPEPADQAGHPPSTRSTTAAATSSNAASTSSNTGEESPPGSTVRMSTCRPVLRSDPRYDRPRVP